MPMPMETEPITDEINYKLVEYARESRTYLGGQLQESHDKMTIFWKRYLSQRDDPRDPVTEKWRSHIVVPQAYFNVEAKVAQLEEILMSADPPIQPDPVFESSEADSKGITDLLDYTMRTNKFRTFLAGSLRATSVQGTEFFKSVWKEKSVMVPRRVTPEQLQDFQKRVVDAQAASGLPSDAFPDWMENPAGFEQMRKNLNIAKPGLNLPQAPNLSGQPEKVITFWGPFMERIPIWQLFLDPQVQEISDQPVVIHEMFKSRAWLESMTGADPTKPFDPERVQKAMNSWSAETMSSQQEDLNNKLKIPSGIQKNPQYQQPVKIWEVWRLNSAYPFQVVLNQEQVINKDPRVMPFEHGQIPIGHMRNVLIPGYALGMSDIEPSMSLLEEQDTFRSLRMDKTTLYTLPVFQKLQGFGIPDLQRKLAPGGIIEVSRLDGIRELISGDVKPGAFSESAIQAADIDRTFGIGENVRGGQANINRVSASESNSRLNQALTRLKLNAIQIEDDLSAHVGQWLALYRQFGTVENRPTLAGYDPLAKINFDQLTVALAKDYRFRGATQAVSREIQAQALTQFGDKFKAVMLPIEVRALMREVGMALGLRGMSKIVSEAGDQMLQAQFEAEKAAQASQNQAAKTQTDQVAQTATAPTEVPLD